MDAVTADAPIGAAATLRVTLRRFLDRHLATLFLLPGIGLIVIVLTYPVVSNIYLSLTNKHLVFRSIRYIGLENFAFTLGDGDFYTAFGRTVIFTLASVALQLVVGFAVALLLNLPLRGRIFFRLAMIVPYAFPPVAVALVWKWILHSLFGVLNFTLMGLGLIEIPIPWLSQEFTAMSSAILVNLWFGFPLFALAILAGLQSIPEEHFEVARLEGARPHQMVRYVILPAVLRIIGIIVVLRTIWIFNTFDLIFVLTGGGPVNATETLPLYAYRIGWGQGFIGQTAAIAVLLFGVLAVMIWFYFRLFRIEEDL